VSTKILVPGVLLLLKAKYHIDELSGYLPVGAVKFAKYLPTPTVYLSSSILPTLSKPKVLVCDWLFRE
jgi:hypothetical protein